MRALLLPLFAALGLVTADLAPKPALASAGEPAERAQLRKA